MVKVCAVAGCPSGRKRDRAKRRALGMRNLSLFSVPKGTDLLNEWSKALRVNLTAKDVICELHFPSESVITSDMTLMPDGSVHCLPRDRARLTKDAVPHFERNQETIEDIGIDISEDRVDSLRSTINFNEQQLDDIGEEMITDLLSQDHSVSLAANINIEEQLSEGFDGNSNTEIGYDLPTNDQLADLQFSMEDLLRYFDNTPWRKFWCWLPNIREQQIVLMHIDSRSSKIRLFLKIQKNLSVTAHTNDDSLQIELCESISSVEVIPQLLDTVENKLLVCSGTGITAKSRADNCSGFMSTADFERFVSMPRCCECIRVRKNLRRQRRTDLRTRYSRVRYRSKLKQRKVERLKKKSNITEHTTAMKEALNYFQNKEIGAMENLGCTTNSSVKIRKT